VQFNYLLNTHFPISAYLRTVVINIKMNEKYFGAEDKFAIENEHKLLETNNLSYIKTVTNDFHGSNIKKYYTFPVCSKKTYKNFKLIGVCPEDIECVYYQVGGQRINHFDYSLYRCLYEYNNDNVVIIPFEFVIPLKYHENKFLVILKSQKEIQLQYDEYSNEKVDENFKGLYKIIQYQCDKLENDEFTRKRINFNHPIYKLIFTLPDDSYMPQIFIMDEQLEYDNLTIIPFKDYAYYVYDLKGTLNFSMIDKSEIILDKNSEFIHTYALSYQFMMYEDGMGGTLFSK